MPFRLNDLLGASPMAFAAIVAVGVVLVLVLAGLWLLGYWVVTQNERGNRNPLSVPQGFEGRLAALAPDIESLESLGFRVEDQFLLSSAIQLIVTLMRHEKDPFIVGLYDIGVKRTCDVITSYEKDLGLTTGSAAEAGSMPRPPGDLVQVFPGALPVDLVEQHAQAHQFLLSKGARVAGKRGPLRDWFLNEVTKSSAYIRRQFLWPLRVIGWSFSPRRKRFRRSIEEQHAMGMIPMLDTLEGPR